MESLQSLQVTTYSKQYHGITPGTFRLTLARAVKQLFFPSAESTRGNLQDLRGRSATSGIWRCNLPSSTY